MCFLGPAVNTSLYAYLPLSMRKIVLTNLPGADLDARRAPAGFAAWMVQIKSTSKPAGDNMTFIVSAH